MGSMELTSFGQNVAQAVEEGFYGRLIGQRAGRFQQSSISIFSDLHIADGDLGSKAVWSSQSMEQRIVALYKVCDVGHFDGSYTDQPFEISNAFALPKLFVFILSTGAPLSRGMRACCARIRASAHS